MLNIKRNKFSITVIFIVLTVFLFILQTCKESRIGFREFLYNLSDIAESQRQQKMDDYINSAEDFPLMEDSTVFFIYKNEKDLPVYLAGDMNSWKTFYLVNSNNCIIKVYI